MQEPARNVSAAQAITAYVLPDAPTDVARLIRPARAPRRWMDRTPERYAYRCIPLSAANTLGWEILNPVECEMIWNGLTPPEQVLVYQPQRSKYGARSHFGSGVVTWELPFLFQTPPEYGLVVCGPANHDQAHITPLDAFVRTDWLPFPFTVNWRITAKGEPVRFEKHEPIARIFPFPLNLLDDLPFELTDLAANPELEARFRSWRGRRRGQYGERDEARTAGEGVADERDAHWGRNYARGEGSESARTRHKTVFRCQEVRDRRRRGGNERKPGS